MERKTVSETMLALLLTSMLTLPFNIQPVKASGTIYITADGGVAPSTAPIQRDGDIYTFTDDIYDEIVVERSNIIVDGNGYTLHGLWRQNGFYLSGITNVTILNTNIKNFIYGVHLYSSSNNIVSGNNLTNNSYGITLRESSNNINISGNKIAKNSWGIRLSTSSNNNCINGNNITENNGNGIELFHCLNNTISGNDITANSQLGMMLSMSSNYNTISGNKVAENQWGIRLHRSSNNSVSGNNIANNYAYGIKFEYSSNCVSGNNIANNLLGIDLYDSSDNRVFGNNITNNEYGFWLPGSSNNFIYHNNFVANTVQGVTTARWVNIWDDGYPSGGNYWSDYEGRYPDAEELDGSGIWDTPYVIDVNNKDNYPLIEPWTPLPRIIGQLKTKVEEIGSGGQIDNQGIAKSLIAKLNVAQKLVDKGKIDEAKTILADDFTPQVQNLLGVHITPEAVDILIKAAEYIIAHI